jgi:protein-S-isoprenylcysteine O-methyltransferase Ste14
MNNQNDRPNLVLNPFLIYIGSGAAAAVLQLMAPLPFLPKVAAQIIGVGLMAVNLMIGLPAVRGMFKSHTSPNPHAPSAALVRSGPYRFTRNPMYIGLTLLYAGLMVFFRLPWGVLLTPVVIWLITTWVIRPEEDYLEQKFGGEYTTYKTTVRRWI